MWFRILGPLRMGADPAGPPVTAAQQRLVLAILLVEAGRTVSKERLVDEIWGERPPRAAVSTVQGYIMRLRRLLAADSGAELLTRGHGYELDLHGSSVDATVFEQHVQQGQRRRSESDPEGAIGEFSAGLALWRGPALVDVPPSPTVTPEAARLEQLRLTAVEERAGAQLDLGRHADVADELQRMVHEHPLREQLWARLMLAQHRCGRRAEALQAYRQARRALVEALGLEPGRPLRELHAAILADEPSLRLRPGGGADPATDARQPTIEPGPVAEQLPADVAAFTGRNPELARLDGALGRQVVPAPAVVVISTIDGTAGVGKTALAVRWAYRVRARYPDGQLFADLRGYSAGAPAEPGAVLARFLRALGVPAGRLPDDLEEAAALYRSRLAGRRMLIMLDDAHSAEQVRPLLPGSPGCVVVVTSRHQLTGLVAHHGAVQVPLDVLSPAEARQLLARLLGAGRVDAEPEPAARLAAVCGYLPLALRIVAAKLAGSPETGLADFTRELAAGDRLAALDVPGDARAGVRVALTQSYDALPPPAQRLFRLLGLVPGPHVSVAASAALTNLPRVRAAQLLDRLAAAHLLDEHADGRYSFHDLVRDYAAERASTADSQPDRRAALDRLYEHYLRGVSAAARHVYPQVLRLPMPPGGAPGPSFDGHRAAADWLDVERPNLVAAVLHAAEHGAPAAAWRLTDAMRGYLYVRMHTHDWRAVAQAGLAAADLDGDAGARAAARICLATVDWVQGAHQRAIGHFGAALALARTAGWVDGESAVLGNLGNLYWAQGRLDEAAAQYRQTLTLHRASGRPAQAATDLDNLGLVHFGLGQLDTAVEHYTEALAMHREVGARSGEARTLTHLGDAYRAQGRLGAAVATLTEARSLLATIGDRNVEGDTARNLAAALRDAGRLDEALEQARHAMAIARDNDDRRLTAGATTTHASVQHRLGRLAEAVDGHRHARVVAHAVGNRYLEAEALIGLTAAAHQAGDRTVAVAAVQDAIDIARSDGYALLERAADELRTALLAHPR